MKTDLHTVIAMLALAGGWLVGMASPASAQPPQTFQAGQFAAYPGAAMPPQGFPGGPAYGPYAYPGGGGPACGPYGCSDGCPSPECPTECCPCEQPHCSCETFFELLCGGQWRIAVDGVLMGRSSPESQTLVRNGFDTSSAEVFNANQLHFPSSGGFSASATRAGPFGWDIELAFTQVDSFCATTIVPGDVFVEADAANEFHSREFIHNPRLDNASQLRTAEANFWRESGERVRLMAGFRWIGFDDFYAASGVGAAPVFAPVVVTLNNRALNSMYGGQIGGDIKLIDCWRVAISAGGKVGAYGNACRQTSREVDPADVPPFDRQVDTAVGHAAFAAELDVMGTFEVIMDRLYFRAGYQVLWVDGVLLAPDQIAVNNITAGTGGTRFDTVVFYGAHLGMELRF